MLIFKDINIYNNISTMSRFLEDEYIVYHKFQKIFNNFDIFMKRELVTYFMNDLGEGNKALDYFNDETNIELSMRTINPDYHNASNINLNIKFFNMKYDRRFYSFMQKIIEKYSV